MLTYLVLAIPVLVIGIVLKLGMTESGWDEVNVIPEGEDTAR